MHFLNEPSVEPLDEKQFKLFHSELSESTGENEILKAVKKLSLVLSREIGCVGTEKDSERRLSDFFEKYEIPKGENEIKLIIKLLSKACKKTPVAN